MDSTTKGLASSTLGRGHKKTIHQNIPNDSVKKGPYAIVRTADLSDGIEILRRVGEGSKPLFARGDIEVNQTTTGDKHDVSGHDAVSSAGCKSKIYRSSFSTESSSPELYRHRDNKKYSPPPPTRRKSSESSIRNERHTYDRDKYSHTVAKSDRYTKKENSKSRSPVPVKKRPTEKAPYFRDEVRERERLRRLYGNRDRARSRSHTPPPSKNYRSIDSTKRRRSTSRDKYQRRSPYRSSRRDYRSLKSRSRSRTRSPQRRERVSHKHSSRSSRERDNTAAVITPTPQFIPIPVAVPAEFAYSLPGWPTSQPAWPPSQHRPPMAHYPPYHILPMMPPIRPPHPASYGGLPPNLYGVPYRSQMFIPQRHSLNCYQAHSKKPSK